MRILYYSAKKMVMAEKYVPDASTTVVPGGSTSSEKVQHSVKYYNGFSVFQMPRAVGTYYAYLERIRDIGDNKYTVCDAGFVNLYNDPSSIYVKEIAERVGDLRSKGVVVSLASPEEIHELEAFLTGWFMHVDVPEVYLQLVVALHRNTDKWLQVVNTYKSNSLLSAQPASVQSIFRFLVAKTSEWTANHQKVYGVPLSMVVKETGLKETTVMDYLRRLEAVGLVKINLIDKKYYYLPIEQ